MVNGQVNCWSDGYFKAKCQSRPMSSAQKCLSLVQTKPESYICSPGIKSNLGDRLGVLRETYEAYHPPQYSGSMLVLRTTSFTTHVLASAVFDHQKNHFI